MTSALRVSLAQINPTVGDIPGNTELITAYTHRARELGADLVAFPELAITGYPPEDLLLKPSFIDDNLACLHQLAAHSRDITIIVGFVDMDEDIYNAAGVLHGGEVRCIYHKMYLPNYSVFDEERYFQRGDTPGVYELGGAGIGVNICEDIWYPTGPTAVQALAGAEVILSLNASPYRQGTPGGRERMLATRAQDHTAFVCYVNQVGGQDELVFDGASAVFNAEGETIARAPSFEEALLTVDLELASVAHSRLRDPRGRKLAASGNPAGSVRSVELGKTLNRREKRQLSRAITERSSEVAEIYSALQLALRDYVRKSGFKKVVVALSGGIDSSLVAALAADALGGEHVIGVSMPSRYSSDGSRTDAAALATNLGIELLTIPIDAPFAAFLDLLAPHFEGTEPGLAEENLQARCRANIMMSLSNKFGWLVVTTGNKSETAVGYSTLYGDTAGGFALIRDVPKTTVYELARYRNTLGEVIPRSVLEKPPSAELRPDQKDEDSLPPYSVLDPILRLYIEEDYSPREIEACGFDLETVTQVITLVDRSEYKRRQSPPGPKVTPRAFGRDRRLPIVNRYRGSTG